MKPPPPRQPLARAEPKHTSLLHDDPPRCLTPIFARYGFPGKTNRSWGWLGGDSLSDELPWEKEDEQYEDEGEEEGAGDGVPTTPSGEVVGLKSREDLRALVEEGGTMVFVSSRSCRACKYLTP